MRFLGAIVRFVVSALVLMFVGMFVTGFSRLSFTSALIAAVVIAVIGWLVEMMFGRNVAPYGRGIVGFLTSIVVIYVAQWFVPGMEVTLLGAVIAAAVIAIVDLFIPGDVSGNVFGNRRSERVRDDD
ncbi:MAG TPA: phage holin family protein [Bacilli bacterium]|nr:phage holin family protein [Bacilli bacterium]